MLQSDPAGLGRYPLIYHIDSCADVVQMHGAGESLNMLVFPLVLDTLCYTLDGECA